MLRALLAPSLASAASLLGAQEVSETKYPPVGLPAELVRYVPLPGGGKHPRLHRGEDGRIHVAFFREAEGAPEGVGDLFYTSTADDGASFETPIRINSVPGNATLGRGVNAARIFTADETVHVAWTGAAPNMAGSGSDEPGQLAAYYARRPKGEAKFEKQELLSTGEGFSVGTGVAVVANKQGVVLAFFVASTDEESTERKNYRIYCRRSSDGGQTLGAPVAIDDAENGVSALSAVDAAIDVRGWIYLAYRTEVYKERRRDVRFLYSTDHGLSFTTQMLTPIVRAHDQQAGIEIRPTSVGKQMLIACEDRGSVFWTRILGRSMKSDLPSEPFKRPKMHLRSPSVASNQSIAALLAWTEKPKSSEDDEFTVAWQVWKVYQARAPLGRGKMTFATNSTPAAFDRQDGGFVILY